MVDFNNIPPVVAQKGEQVDNANAIAALKDSVERLTGLGDPESRAILQGDIQVEPVNLATVPATARGDGFTVSSVDVAGLEDYRRLIIDVDIIRSQVRILAQTFDALVRSMKRV